MIGTPYGTLPVRRRNYSRVLQFSVRLMAVDLVLLGLALGAITLAGVMFTAI